MTILDFVRHEVDETFVTRYGGFWEVPMDPIAEVSYFSADNLRLDSRLRETSFQISSDHLGTY